MMVQRPSREPECSVELTLNAKGDVQISVSAKGPDVAAMGAAAEAEFDRLMAKYPRPEPTPADEALKEARKVAAISQRVAAKARNSA
jgi:hypothetical protein